MLTGLPLLIEMLSYRRPAGCRAERKFINRYIVPAGAEADAFGNRILRIGTAPILWSSHTDTVHRQGGRQTVEVTDGEARAIGQNCLGADDTTGVWLMLEMIRAGVEGLYIFHRAEEIGCQGSSYIAQSTPEVLDGITHAIAFDRRGTDSIVTHQMGRRCASDAFAVDLAERLGLDLWPDPSGVYTDTVEYVDLVPECTNISVGYGLQHSPHEYQDLAFALTMRNALVRADLSDLTVGRSLSAPAVYWDAPEGPESAPDDDPWWDQEEDGAECDYCWSLPTGQLFEYSGGLVCSECLFNLTGDEVGR